MGSADIGYALGSGIGGGIGNTLSQMINQKLQNKQEQLAYDRGLKRKQEEGQRRSTLMQDILKKISETPNFQNLSLNEQLSFIDQAAAADKEIADSLKKNLVESQKMKLQSDKLTQNQMGDLQSEERMAEFLKQDLEGLSPTEIFKKGIASGLLKKEAFEVANLARQSGREERISEDSIRKVYNADIKELWAEHKDALPSKKAAIKQKIIDLKKERDAKIQRFRKGDRSDSLSQIGGDEEEKQSPLLEKEEIEVKTPQDEVSLKLESVFPPAQFKGQIKKHKATGKQYKSDGVRWLPL